MQSAALLYQLTGDKNYLTDAQNIARACHNYFFMDYATEQDKTIKLLKKGDIWFTAVMLRGFIELYQADRNKIYLDSFNQSLTMPGSMHGMRKDYSVPTSAEVPTITGNGC